jgi:hypothetical protein
MQLPDLSGYQLRRTIDDIDLAGVTVPGLRGSFFRRPCGVRVRSAGVYEYGGTTLFMAWGYVGEEHCRFTALCRDDGSWEPARPGCPEVSVRRAGGRVTGLAVGGHLLPTRHQPRAGAHTPATRRSVPAH